MPYQVAQTQHEVRSRKLSCHKITIAKTKRRLKTSIAGFQTTFPHFPNRLKPD
ncbi:hypothetical protein NEISICOT_00671 [Neisseria sicca ATCC 29256]|uniref:Uncharacterized protein n=1 Tax=Neisseria sicca ATCC 29256 TaxID=547045 RepID=C6M2D2_NEISI|nr:hypothetical protein NEISICOT_00671 [Neisseria sicca ATCC 29256]